MDTTVSLRGAGSSWGPDQNADEVFPQLYAELRRLANLQLARMRGSATLQPTALVHEAYLKLVGRSDAGWEERRHFFAAAAQAMREIVIDHVRKKRARKRGGGEKPSELDAAALDAAALDAPVQAASAEDVLAVNDAMGKLEVEHPRKAEIAILRYFGGLSVQEIAELMGVSTRTIEREWRFGRAYLRALLASADA